MGCSRVIYTNSASVSLISKTLAKVEDVVQVDELALFILRNLNVTDH